MTTLAQRFAAAANHSPVLRSRIIKTSTELDQWLVGVRTQVEKRLKDGPVIL